ncbi:MAG: ATP-dependent sacrificial sulfur transferase LarE [Actinomycetota bacterium]
MDRKIKKLKRYLKSLESVVVAYSGGIDSSFLAMVSHKVLGDNAAAATAVSPLIPPQEIDESRTLAGLIGISQHLLPADILSVPGFRKNPKNRCYRCKKEIFTKICQLRKKLGYAAVIEGSNTDDIKSYRPGLQALKEMGILSPLAEAGLKKEEIRKQAKLLGLPNYGLPSSACLATRIPYHQVITLKKLNMVNEAENFIKGLGFRMVRVRYHSPVARIEVEENKLEKILENGIYKKISAYLKELGFNYITIDLEGFRSGSLDENV